MLSPFESELVDLEKMSQPTGAPGGKRHWIKILLSLVPEHDVYVEPYAGGAKLFWSKVPATKSVLNDINPDIMAVYKFLKSGTDKDFAWMRKRKWTPSQAFFSRVKNMRPTSVKQQAYRQKYLSLWSRRTEGRIFSEARNPGWEKSPDGIASRFLKNLEKFRERLRNTTLSCTKAFKVIDKHDADSVFVYLDPPWKAIASGEQWKGFDHLVFAEKVKTMCGNVLVSLQGESLLVEDKQWKKQTFEVKISGYSVKSTQDIYMNYSLDKATHEEEEEGDKQEPGDREGGNLLTPLLDQFQEHLVPE